MQYNYDVDNDGLLYTNVVVAGYNVASLYCELRRNGQPLWENILLPHLFPLDSTQIETKVNVKRICETASPSVGNSWLFDVCC